MRPQDFCTHVNVAAELVIRAIQLRAHVHGLRTLPWEHEDDRYASSFVNAADHASAVTGFEHPDCVCKIAAGHRSAVGERMTTDLKGISD